MQMIFGMITSCIRGFRVLRGTWFGVSATAPRDYIESAIVTRNGSLGSGPADVVPVRLDPDLRAALGARAEAEHTSASSDVIQPGATRLVGCRLISDFDDLRVPRFVMRNQVERSGFGGPMRISMWLLWQLVRWP
jgi:hypothetical protein